MSQIIREHISRLREAVDKRHREGHDALDRLQESLLGDAAAGPAETLGPIPRDENVPHTHSNGDQRSEDGASNVKVVLAAIRGTSLTVAEIGGKTGLDLKKIRGVLYSKAVEPNLAKNTRGKTVKFALKPSSEESGESTSTIILRILKKEGGLLGLPVAAINKKLAYKTTNRNTISSALYNLKKAEKIDLNASGNYHIVQVSGAGTGP